MQLPLVSIVLREASALMRISSYIFVHHHHLSPHLFCIFIVFLLYFYCYKIYILLSYNNIYPSREPSAQS